MKVNYDKLRGGYYTPELVSQFLSKWVLEVSNDVLEPSAGDGSFVKSIVELGKNVNVTSIELDPKEGNKIKKIYKQNNFTGTHIDGDFFTQAKKFIENGIMFDGVLGNPPFIRYQNFVEEYRETAFKLMNSFGLYPNRLTNIWVPFLVICSKLLKKDGRLGMVIPAELFQVNYAADTRKFLSDEFCEITIITFQKLLFSKVQQEVVLILAEKDGKKTSQIRTLELTDETELESVTSKKLANLEAKDLLHSKDKWTYYFLEKNEINFLHGIREKTKCDLASKYIDVDVGVVTGRNNFFILKPNEIFDRKLSKSTLNIVTRSNHLKGILFSKNDWEININDNLPSYMFYPEDKEYEKLNVNERSYIDYGEKNLAHKGYKCRIRKKWFIVPSVHVPDAFMLRQVHEYPKLIQNLNGATSTDTIHRVKILHPNKDKVIAAFLNSLTLVYAELMGRSYGGGVLTFEPSECEMLPLPTKGMDLLDPKRIDKHIRSKEIEMVLDINDKILLEDNLELSNKEVKEIRKIWNKLKNRRINRRK